MATFSYNGITYTAIFVDTAAASGGDGTTISTPINVFPAFSGIAANTAVICRNGGQISGYGFGTLSNGNANILITGAPKPGENLYDVIPGAATWGGDLAETFTISFNGTQSASYCWWFSNGSSTISSIYLGRLTLQTGNGVDTQGAGSNAIVVSYSTYLTVYKCTFKVIGYSYNDSQDPGNGTLYGRNAIMFTPNSTTYSSYGDLIVDQCLIDLPGQSGIYNGSPGGNTSIMNSIIRMWNAVVNHQCVGYQEASALGTLYIKGCDILIKTSRASSSGGCQAVSCYRYTDINNCTLSVTLNVSRSVSFGDMPINLLSSASLIQNSTFTLQPYTTSNVVVVRQTDTGGVRLYKNCTFQTIGSNSLNQGLCYAILPTGTGGTATFSSCLFNANGIIGNDGINSPILNFSNCSFLQGSFVCNTPLYVSNLTSQNLGGGIYARSGAIYYIGTASLAAASTKQVSLFGTAKVFVDNLDIDPTSYVNFNSSDDAALYVKNENGVTGNWTARSLKTKMVYSNTYRSGGASYAIKCQSNALPLNLINPPVLWIAPEPFAGIPVTISSPGSYTINLYFAHKLYDPADTVNLKNLMMYSYFTNSLGINNSYHTNSRGNGSMIADGSTWNNDSGLTTMVLKNKIEVPAGISYPVTVYTRIGFFKYQTGFPSGYLVLDPYVVAVPV
jgi:hypothetical protein